MKNYILILFVLIHGFIYSQNFSSVPRHFTREQKVKLEIRDLAIDLDLSHRQIRRLEPLLHDYWLLKKTMKKEERKLLQGKDISDEEKFETMVTLLDQKDLIYYRISNLLKDHQYFKFVEIQRAKEARVKKVKNHSKSTPNKVSKEDKIALKAERKALNKKRKQAKKIKNKEQLESTNT